MGRLHHLLSSSQDDDGYRVYLPNALITLQWNLLIQRCGQKGEVFCFENGLEFKNLLRIKYQSILGETYYLDQSVSVLIEHKSLKEKDTLGKTTYDFSDEILLELLPVD